MTANPDADEAAPRDAASIVVFDTSAGDIRVLMGQRGAGQAFMPNRFVFPGGRVDASDVNVEIGCDGLGAAQLDFLGARTAGPLDRRARQSLAVAAVRETFEEAGLVFGTGAPGNLMTSSELPLIWQKFSTYAAAPAISDLTFFARAITPPGRPRRYDTRFFCVPRSKVITEIDETDGELSNLDWYPVARLTELNLAPITQYILKDFTAWMEAEQSADCGAFRIPFYHHEEGVFRRDVLVPLCPQDG